MLVVYSYVHQIQNIVKHVEIQMLPLTMNRAQKKKLSETIEIYLAVAFRIVESTDFETEMAILAVL